MSVEHCKSEGMSHWHKYSKQKGKGNCKFPEAVNDSGLNFDKDGSLGDIDRVLS